MVQKCDVKNVDVQEWIRRIFI